MRQLRIFQPSIYSVRSSKSSPIQLLPCGKLLKRIPRTSREHAAKKLISILDGISAINDIDTWMRLLKFPRRCFQVPHRGGRRRSLVTQVNNQISEETDPQSSLKSHPIKHTSDLVSFPDQLFAAADGLHHRYASRKR